MYSRALDRVDRHNDVLDDETGIVRWLSEIPVEPGEPQVFHYSAKMADTSKYLPLPCPDSNGGAGLTRDWARSAALGEAIERYCASVFFPQDLLLGNHREVERNHRALGPDQVALFHPRQEGYIRYARFAEDTRLAWTVAYSLTERTPALVPACLVYVPYYPFLGEEERTIAAGISTGQACANSLPSAILSGLYEVVERDAFMISWLNRLPLTKFDISDSPALHKIFEDRFWHPGIEYTLFRMATDIDIPAILCLIVDRTGKLPLVCCGGAANLDPEAAALKALIEAVQTRSWARFMALRSEPFVVESDFSNIDDFEKHVFLFAHGDMLPAVEFLRHSSDMLPLGQLGKQTSGDPEKDMQTALTRLGSKGYEVLAVNLTTEDVAACGYHTVKVLVPLLQPMEGDHTHRYLGGERLYTVPQQLGFDVRPTFDNLNSDPHPYP